MVFFVSSRYADLIKEMTTGGAVVNVLVGQCGNQVGTSFLAGLVDHLSDHAASESATSMARLQQTGVRDDQEDASSHRYLDEAMQKYFVAPDDAVARYFAANTATDPPADAPSCPLPLRPRAVLIDMEPKAMLQAAGDAFCRRDGGGRRASPAWTLRMPLATAVTRDSGSANNWAFGYYRHGCSIAADITEAIRKEVEASESLDGVHVVHGAAGGTGSGVGALVADLVRESLAGGSRGALLHTMIWPFTGGASARSDTTVGMMTPPRSVASGEVVTQAFNTILTLHVLNEQADAVHFLSNDEAAAEAKYSEPTNIIRSELSRHSSGAGGGAADSFASANQVLTRHLLALHLPRSERPFLALPDPHRPHHPSVPPRPRTLPWAWQCWGGGTSLCRLIGDITGNDRDRKLFSSIVSPHDGVTTTEAKCDGHVAWASVHLPVLRVVHRLSVDIAAGCFLLRGLRAESEGADALESTFQQFVTDVAPGSLCRSSPRLLWSTVAASIPPCGRESSNRNGHLSTSAFLPTLAIGERVARMAQQAEQLVHARAFVHHYERYGVELDDLREAIYHAWVIAGAYGYD